MNLAELFPEGGRGIIGTADADGVVNLALFAVPQVIDEQTLAWGFVEGRSLQNLRENPNACYLYLAPSRGYSGWRLTLTLLEETGEGELLASIKAQATQTMGSQIGGKVERVARFRVEEVRPLI